MRLIIRSLISVILLSAAGVAIASCAPRIIDVTPAAGAPSTVVNVGIEYLVGWPRVEIDKTVLDWPKLRLLAADVNRKDLRGEDLVWIEDKVLQFTIPDLPPGDYRVTIHDDKGPPGDAIYSFLETTAYVIFPPVWPFVFRSNQTQFTLRVLPKEN